jgi:hypothetical protein
MCPHCSLNVPSLFTKCALTVLWMWTFPVWVLNVPWMCPPCSLNVNLPGMDSECCLDVPWLCPQCSLNGPAMCPDRETSLNGPWMWIVLRMSGPDRTLPSRLPVDTGSSHFCVGAAHGSTAQVAWLIIIITILRCRSWNEQLLLP